MTNCTLELPFTMQLLTFTVYTNLLLVCSSDFHNSNLFFGTPRYSLYVRVMTSAYVKGQPGF